MITDERLDELIELIIRDAYDFNEPPTMTIDKQDVYEMASELLLLREQKRKLVEDGRAMIKELEGAIFVIGEYPIDYSNGITAFGVDEGRVLGAEMERKILEDGHKVIDQHNALMKEIE